LLMACGPACCNDADILAPLGIGDIQKLAAGHTEKDAAFLAVIFPLVHPLDSKLVTERGGGLFKSHAVMVADVARGLLLVPFKSDWHKLLSTRSFVNCPVGQHGTQ